MLSDEARTAAVRGLKRGLVSAVVSLLLLWGSFLVIVRRLRTNHSMSATGAVGIWDHGWWRTPLTALVAILVAITLVVLLARLRARATWPGRIASYAVAYVLGAVPIVLLTMIFGTVLVPLEVPNGPYFPQINAAIAPGLLVGVALAGFGARVLLRHSSLAELWSNPSAVLVDGWLAVLWFGCAVFAFDLAFTSGVGHWFTSGLLRNAPAPFATFTVLFVPVLVLAVLRDVAWSVAVARSGSRAGSADVRSDGGATDAASTRLGVSSDPDDSWRLWPSLCTNRPVAVGVAMLMAFPVTVGAFLVLEWVGVPQVQGHGFPNQLEFLQLLLDFYGGVLASAVIATGSGMLLARRLNSRPDARWIEAIAVDPFTTVLQFPVFLLAALVVGEVILSQFSTTSLYVSFFPSVGVLALVPLVSRVARRDRDLGWSSWRVAVRATGIALCGAAVLSLWVGFFIVYVHSLYWNGLFAYFAFALVHTGGLFLLGDGLRDAASASQN